MERTATGLDEHVAGAASYSLGFITGIFFYLIERQNGFVRFHAAQSMIVFGSLFLASMMLGGFSTAVYNLPGGQTLAAMFATASLLLIPVSLFLWLYLMYKAYNGERYHLAAAGAYAERLV